MIENSVHENHKQNFVVSIALAFAIATATIALVALLTQTALIAAEWFVNTL